MSAQRSVGLWLVGVGIVFAFAGLIGAQFARSSNEDAVYDAEIRCLATQIVESRRVTCELPEPNYGPWIVVGVVGGVLFLAGVVVAATGGSTSTPTTASSEPSIASPPRPVAGGAASPPTQAETAVFEPSSAEEPTQSEASMPTSADSQRDMTRQLRELAHLHASGQLTDAEFTTAKTRVIQGPDS